MLGGMAGGGMGFIFDPAIKTAASDFLAQEMVRVKRQMQTSLPFAMDPVVYDFSINDDGSFATLLTGENAIMTDRYYMLHMPTRLRTDPREHSPQARREIEQFSRRCFGEPGRNTAVRLVETLLPSESTSHDDGATLDQMLQQGGFDRNAHEMIRDDLQAGRIGLAQNRLSANTTIQNVDAQHIIDLRDGAQAAKYADLGSRSIANGEVAVVTLAAGVGSRWTEGAGVCKALHPFFRFGARHRSFLEVHLAKNRRITRQHDGQIPHIFTTSYLTESAICENLQQRDHFGFGDNVHLSSGRSIGLRMVPMIRDLRFLWEETAQQVLDEQQQKVRESVRGALMNWARSVGEGSDYTDNVPSQCIHPVGHWAEIPNMLRNGLLAKLLDQQPSLNYLMLHNIDTLGADVAPSILGRHIAGDATLSYEVITRRLEDRGGGLALVNGRPRLVEGLAMPDERVEFDLTFYNSMTTWITIDGLLHTFGLTRETLRDENAVESGIRNIAARMPTYITLKDVKKRWGHGQEDIFPISQFERLWGDMTTLPDLNTAFFAVPMLRGQQLKSQAQLDGWNRDGSAAEIGRLCDFGD
ncbi:MAG: UTP--glucose-1-phosphate uridylyltransferase, partial [Planctomycetota bacterium]